MRVWRVPGAGENDNATFMPGTIRRSHEFMIHNPGRPFIAFSPDNRVLGFGENFHITLWSGGAAKTDAVRLGYPSPYRYWYWHDLYPYVSGGAMAFSCDGKMLAVGGGRRAGLWKMVK